MNANATRTGRRARAVVVAVVCGLALPLLASTAAAAPAPPPSPANASEAASRVRDTAQQLTQLDEQVAQARLQVAQEQQAAAEATARAAAAQAAVDAYDPQLRAIAQGGVTGSSQSRVAAFLTSRSAMDLVQRMTTLDMIATHTESMIAEVGRAADAAREAKQAAEEATAKAQASLTALEQQQREMQDRVAGYRADLARLSAAERAALTSAIAGPTLSPPSTAQVVAGAPSAAIGVVIRTALAQVGKPYVWGDSGPDGFDCSGLTSFAYAAAGVALPHSSKAQSVLGTAVARSDLRPGDIVYFYSPVSHVGIYLGNGMMIEARTFGHPVSVTSVDRAGYAGARRILG